MLILHQSPEEIQLLVAHHGVEVVEELNNRVVQQEQVKGWDHNTIWDMISHKKLIIDTALIAFFKFIFLFLFPLLILVLPTL